jgi:hypothetical protein
MRHLNVDDVDGLTPLVNTLQQMPLDKEQQSTLHNTVIDRLKQADGYAIDRSIALLKNLALTAQQTGQVIQILKQYLASENIRLWQISALSILQMQSELQPDDPLFEQIYESALSRIDRSDVDARYAAGSVLRALITDERRFNFVLQTLLKRLDDSPDILLPQVIASVFDSADPYRLDFESQKRIMPVLNHSDQRLREQALIILARHLLLLSQAIPNVTTADSLLKNLTEEPQARRHAGYRRALVQALAYWYNAGILRSDDRAAAEHETLNERLQRLRTATTPWWLRAAATEILTTAYRLRS